MYMVGHEAVRNECDRMLICGAAKLRQDALHDSGINEHALSATRAERQEISVRTEVVKTFQACGALGSHAEGLATVAPPPG
jgi:hypothetical protein